MSDYKESSIDDGYQVYRQKMTELFARNSEAGPIFSTDLYARLESNNLGNLWEGFHSRLPEVSRQHYKCWACEAFFSRHLNLVTVNEDGTLRSAILPALEDTPAYFLDAANWIRELVEKSKIQNVFYPSKEKLVLGTPLSPKGWTHFSAVFDPEASRYALKGAEHEYFEINAKFITDLRSVADSSWKNVQLMLDAGKFKDHKGQDQIKWTLDMHTWFEENKSKPGFSALLWVKLAYAPIGWINFKSKSVGNLIAESETNPDAAYLGFLKITDPLVYMRAQKEASDNQLKVAMARVEELGVTKSLYRRPARIDEIRYLWQPEAVAETKAQESGKEANPFGELMKKRKETVSETPNLSSPIEVPFSQFWLHVIPKVKRLRVKPIYKQSLGDKKITVHSFMTAVYPDAPPIMKHDLPEDRYPVNEWTFSQPVSLAHWVDQDVYMGNDWMDVIGVTRACDDIRQPFDFLSEKTQYGFFVIKGMGYTQETNVALFPELLIPELHGIRAAIEHYCSTEHVQHSETRGVEAAGLATIYPMLIEVTLDSGTALYKLTR